MKLIRDLWRGDVRLVVTYWGFGVVGGLIMFGVIALVQSIVSGAHDPALVVSVTIVSVLLALAYAIFVWIAIWRSASKYTGKRTWRILAKTMVVVGILSTIGNLGKLAEPEKFDNATLAETAATINKGLPKMIDDGTRFDSVSSGDRELVYHYTLLRRTAAELDVEKFIGLMRIKLQSGACATQYMQKALGNGVSVSFSYAGSDNQPIGKIVLKPGDCPPSPAKAS